MHSRAALNGMDSVRQAVGDIGGDGSGQAQEMPGGGASGMVAQRPVNLPQHHVRQIRVGRPGPGQVQGPTTQQGADLLVVGRSLSLLFNPLGF